MSGHERIRADPAFHTWAQLIASRNAGTAVAFLFHGTRSELYRSPTPHDCGPPCLVRVERGPTNDCRSPPLKRHPVEAPTGPTFGQLGLPQPLVTALERRGIHRPFAIQTSALPDALAGRDVLGKAATGSGKTLAFGLPLLARIGAEVKQGRRAPRGLVLVPDP